MKQITEKCRKEAESKFAIVFDQEISEFSTELREILIDDMVTALENRLKVLNKTAKKTSN